MLHSSASVSDLRRSEPAGPERADGWRDVVLIDPRGVRRECLQFYLESTGYEPRPFSSIEEYEAAEGSDRPSVLIVCDERCGDEIGDAVRDLVSDPDGSPVLVLANVTDIDVIVGLIESGARGYVPSSSSMSDVIGAIGLVQSGSVYMPADCVVKAARALRPGWPTAACKVSLTAKQMKVVEALRMGKSNKTIAYELNMCESTVKVHIRNVMKMINAKNRTELAIRIGEMI